MEQQRKVYIMSGTHWDREWYRPFQGFRYKLVKIITGVIEKLEADPDFGVFTLDGQTVMLEDYLRVRPEMEERLIKLIQDGRILIGPWYCMPDEILVSGESIIRNLMRGERVSREYGVAPWNYGYICDLFSHTPQIPQIFNSFGIEGALLGRGVNEEDCPMHFLWQSPDGSRCITFKVPDHMLYGDFYCRAILEYDDVATDEEKDEVIRREVQRQFDRTDIPIVLLIDALDHQPIHSQLTDIRARIERLFPGTQTVVGNAADMVEELKAHTDKMPVRYGQMIDGARTTQPAQRAVLHTASSRYDLKKDNDICQTLIERWLSPFQIYAGFHGLDIHRGFLDVAEEFLLKNQPHDSICGCSVDSVHQDMRARSNQVKALAAEAMLDIHHHLLSGVERDAGSDDILVQLLNPLPYKRSEVVTLDIPFPAGWAHTFSEEPYGFEPINRFLLRDADGGEVPYSILNIRTDGFMHEYEDRTYEGDLYTIAFTAKLSPMGRSFYRVCSPPPLLAAVRYLQSMVTGPNTAENEHLALHINANGSLRVTDKASGKLYDRLGQYLDDGELGDGWNHVNPVNDRMVGSLGCAAQIEVLHDGVDLCVFGVRCELRLPAQLSHRQKRTFGWSREDGEERLQLYSRISLKRGARQIEVETELDNPCAEHRLRVLFPTGIQGEDYATSQMFCEVAQSAARRPESGFFNQPDFVERATQGIVYKRDADGTGLGIVSAWGLHEAAHLYGDTLALTLLRSISKTIRTNGEDDGKLLGRLCYRYAIAPLNAEVGFGALQRLQDEMAAGLEAGFARNAAPGAQPTADWLMELEGDSQVLYSTLKFCDGSDDILLRLYNPTAAAGKAVVRFSRPLAGVCMAAMNEVAGAALPIEGDGFTAELAPYKIQSYILKVR